MITWFKTENELPPPDVYVLGYYATYYTESDPHWNWDEDTSRFTVCKLNEDYEWCDDEGKNELIEPSHWAHLPLSPEV